MADPERLLSQTGSDSALAQLLRAGADERPSHDAMLRTLAAVGIAGALVGAAGGAQAAGVGAASGAAAGGAVASGSSAALGKASAGAVLFKWLGAGVVAGGLATGVANVATTSAPAPGPTPQAVVSSPLPTRVPSAAPLRRPVATDSPAFAGSSSSPPVPRPNATLAPTQLSAELASLRRVKALSVTSPTAALRELDEYREKFPRGKMSFEASFLGMQTAQRAGQRPLAERYAREVLAFQVHGPQADQARALLGQ